MTDLERYQYFKTCTMEQLQHSLNTLQESIESAEQHEREARADRDDAVRIKGIAQTVWDMRQASAS